MSVAEEQALTERPQWTPLSIGPIDSPEQYVGCAEHLKTIKAYQKRVMEFFKPHKRRLDEAKAALLEDERKALQPANDAEAACKRALQAFDEQQERIRLGEELRLRELARIEEERRRLDEAAALEREGNATDRPELILEAEDLLNARVQAPAVIVEKSTPKVSGISYRENWGARVVSLPKLIAYVAAHPEHANLLTPNMTALNALARSLKQGMRVEGVEAVCTRTTAAGSR